MYIYLEYDYNVLKSSYLRFVYGTENLTKWSERIASFNIFTIDHN